MKNLSCDQQSAEDVLHIIYNKSLRWMGVVFHKDATLPQIRDWFEHVLLDLARATKPLLQTCKPEEEASAETLTYRVWDTHAHPFNVDYILHFYFAEEVNAWSMLFLDVNFRELPLAPGEVRLDDYKRFGTPAMSGTVMQLWDIISDMREMDREIDLGPDVTLDATADMLEWLIKTCIDRRRYRMHRCTVKRTATVPSTAPVAADDGQAQQQLQPTTTDATTRGLLLLRNDAETHRGEGGAEVLLDLDEVTCGALFKDDRPHTPGQDLDKRRIVLRIITTHSPGKTVEFDGQEDLLAQYELDKAKFRALADAVACMGKRNSHMDRNHRDWLELVRRHSMQ